MFDAGGPFTTQVIMKRYMMTGYRQQITLYLLPEILATSLFLGWDGTPVYFT